jgi:iron(III) transport system substrate-binding protein
LRTRRMIVSLILFVPLAACGGDDGADGRDAPGSALGAGSASGASEDTLDEKAELVIYSGRNEELVDPLIERFEQESGYDVSVRYGSSAEMGAALLEEGDRSPADVFFSQEVGAVGVLEKAGMLAELPAEVVERADERFRPAAGNRWVGVTGRSRVIVFNPDLVDAPPTGVLDLVGAEYAGKVAWVPSNAGFQAFITAFRVSQGNEAAREWLEAMKINGAQEYASNDEVLAAVDNGDIAIGLINHYYWAQLLAEVGEAELDAEIVFPKGDDPGGLVNATAVGILEGAADSEAALAFVEFLLSETGQTYFTEETQEYPVVDGIPDPDGIPPLEELEGPAIDLTDLESLEATQRLLTDVGLLS